MDYAIGDIQGCYREFMVLLEKIQFDESSDRLWLVGDLVNRGPDSLSVLRFLSQLAIQPLITLGNHDLHFLAMYYKLITPREDDTLAHLINAKDSESLVHWLKQQPLCVFDPVLNVFMSHAGIPPYWTVAEALSYSKEVTSVLNSSDYLDYLKHMYGNEPSLWQDSLTGFERLRLITNYFTRMRYLKKDGALCLKEKAVSDNPELTPWFDFERKEALNVDIIFGHWAALEGNVKKPGIFALDTGCIWGGKLTAMCLQTKIKTAV